MPPSCRRPLVVAVAVLLVQSAYLGVSASPTLFYVANIFLHHYGGIVLALLLAAPAVRGLATARRTRSGAFSLGVIALWLAVGAVCTAVAIDIVHNTAPHRWLLHVHIGLACGAVLTAWIAVAQHARQHPGTARWTRNFVGGAALLALGVTGVGLTAGRHSDLYDTIKNPDRPPLSMVEEAMGGAEGPFFPSSAATSTGGHIPSDFFMTSASCRRCHADIYDQWAGSAHHFSSFNNQWYRKAIEYMQQTNAIESAKWCGGCHDHAVLFNGMMDAPVSEFLDTQEAHTGIGCNSCHAITQVKGTMGNGGFFLEYPPLHDLAVSDNPILRWIHDKAVELDPQPHKDVFMQPFHRQQTAEFCASCHKAHLDRPVNNYRWLRGFNEYDNWQSSGVSGMGARSFYYPPAPLDCADCHMSLVASDDKGNIGGYVHDHSFLAANTALPTANLGEDQLRRTIDFLQSYQVTVDIFAATPAQVPERGGRVPGPSEPQIASTFAVGEEVASAVGRAGSAGSRELAPVWGPLDQVGVTVQRGDEVRLEVVVRTRGVGHFFPGGTIDAFDVWLELRAVDDLGRTVFWSGVAADNGRGPVDEGAQFYGARMVDARGNRIDKRNAWAARAVAWVNLIPPGAADVAHFRLRVPEDCGNELRLEARLNYRKFSHTNTAFSFAGTPAAGEPGAEDDPDRVTPHFDDRVFVVGDVPPNVSAELREIPTLPIVVMHRAEAALQVTAPGTAPQNATSVRPEDFLRWNDYGIGLLRQGDLAGARRAFMAVTEANAAYADGFVNLARVALQEGLLEEAEAALVRARERDPDLAKTHYFLGVIAKERGEYPEALERFEVARAAYPRDRVVLNAIGRVLFLERRYEEAVSILQTVLDIDAEDLAAHYNLMLCYKGLGRLEDAELERALYERFKADEDAPAILGPYLRAHPEDNRMRQPVHEQKSVSTAMIAREVALRQTEGEPYVVLPGMAADFARRVTERGVNQLPELGAARVLGPTEAGFVQPSARHREVGQ